MVKRKYQGCCYALWFGHGFDIWGECDMEILALKSDSTSDKTFLNLLTRLDFSGCRYELN